MNLIDDAGISRKESRSPSARAKTMSQQTSSAPASPGPAVKPDRVFQMFMAFAPPLIVQASIENRLFDTLATAGPQTAEQVAQKTGASPRGVRIVLNALVGLELLRRQGETYQLTPESEAFLVSTKPSFI